MEWISLQSRSRSEISLSNIKTFCRYASDHCKLYIEFQDGKHSDFTYDSEGTLLVDLDRIKQALQKEKKMEKNSSEDSILTDVRQYLNKYKNVLFTLAALFLVDQFFFGGKLRGRFQEMIENLFNRLSECLKPSTKEVTKKEEATTQEPARHEGS